MGEVKRVGTGEHAVLCLHGWFGSADGWGYLPEVVDGTTYSYYFPQMRGYGARKGETGEFTMQEYAADALASADELGLRTFSVVGHSMGGKAAASLLQQAGDRVRALVGISAVSPAPMPLDEDGHELFFGAPDDPEKRRAIIDFTTGNRNSGAWLDSMRDFSTGNSDVAAVAGAVQSWVNDDYSVGIGSPSTPIAVVVGEHDPALSADAMRQTWLQQYAGVELIELPACGHYAMHEVPVALATAIEAFLADK